MNWIDSDSWVDESVTVVSSSINSLLFADDLVLLASSEKDFNMYLIDFQHAT